MGGCNRGGYRGHFLRGTIGAIQVNTVFNNVDQHQYAAILRNVQDFGTGTINAIDARYGSPLLFSVLRQLLRDNLNQNEYNEAKRLVISLTARDGFDISVPDEDNNTILHRVFWYANNAENEQQAREFAELGCTMLRRIRNSGRYHQLAGIRNKYGETFLDNLFRPTSGHAGQYTPMIMDIINPVLTNTEGRPVIAGESSQNLLGRVSSPVDATIQFDANYPLSLYEQLADSVNDVATFEVHDNPMLYPAEGHTADNTTWAGVHHISPFTRTRLHQSDLIPNTVLSSLCRVYQASFDAPDPVTLVNQCIQVFEEHKNDSSMLCNNYKVVDVIEKLKAYISANPRSFPTLAAPWDQCRHSSASAGSSANANAGASIAGVHERLQTLKSQLEAYNHLDGKDNLTHTVFRLFGSEKKGLAKQQVAGIACNTYINPFLERGEYTSVNIDRLLGQLDILFQPYINETATNFGEIMGNYKQIRDQYNPPGTALEP